VTSWSTLRTPADLLEDIVGWPYSRGKGKQKIMNSREGAKRAGIAEREQRGQGWQREALFFSEKFANPKHYITLHWFYFDNLTQRNGEVYVQTNYTVTLRPKRKPDALRTNY
jgi:DUF1680 family protein